MPLLAVAAGVLVAAFVIFGPALTAPFDFDDGPAIVTNTTIRRLWPPTALLHAPLGTPVSGRPIVNYSFAIDYAVNRWLGIAQTPSPAAPHETIGFHVANVLLLFQLAWVATEDMRRRGAGPGMRVNPVIVAFIAAALFGLHPLMTEAVGYISGRSEVLYMAKSGALTAQ